MSTWPGTLPQRPDAVGFTEAFPDVLVRTEMDAGPPKVRKRFTAASEVFDFSITVDEAQLAILHTFFVTTINGGADEFDWVNPRTNAAAVVRIVGPPLISVIRVGHFKAHIQLEVLP